MAYTASDDKARLDRDFVWHMMHTVAYWNTWRTRADVERQIDNAWRVVGVYDDASGDQVGYCMAVSDDVCFAYLDDVIVDPAHRGQGIGKLLLRTMVEDGPGSGLTWLLLTKDAHGLYEQFGFQADLPIVMARLKG